MARTKDSGNTANTTADSLCHGGQSFNCRKDAHLHGSNANVLCYRCQTRLGCSLCTEHPAELICLYCHNWATQKAVRIHGDIVPNAKVPQVNTDAGWISEHKLTEQVNSAIRGFQG